MRLKSPGHQLNLPTGSYGRVALVTILLGMLGLAQPGAAQTGAVIFVTTTVDKISSTGGCSLQEAIYSANLDNNIAVDSINSDGSDHFITTGCVAGSGNDTIVLPTNAVFPLSSIVAADSHNPFGPTATPSSSRISPSRPTEQCWNWWRVPLICAPSRWEWRPSTPIPVVRPT